VFPASTPLESLRVFEACARHGNFTRAAEELCVTTTAVSQRIRDLERRLGTLLFQRHGPRVQLTTAGRTLSDGVGNALAILRDSIAESTRSDAPLRVTCTPTFGNRWLLPRLPAYHSRADAEPIIVDISIEQRDPRDFDVAVRSGTGPWSALRSVRLFPIEMTPLMTPDLAGELTADPATLTRLPLIPSRLWPAWFALAKISLSEAKFTAAAYSTQDANCIAAENGEGTALLSPRLFSRELERGTLVAPFKHILSAPDSYWLLWHSGRLSSFTTWLQEQLAAERSREQRQVG